MSNSTAAKPVLDEPKHTRVEKLLARLGPGLVTGAADDDPSGIATYSQAGAQFGFAMLWVMLFSFPLMAVIQEICGRLGRITDWVWPRTWRNATPRSWSAVWFYCCVWPTSSI